MIVCKFGGSSVADAELIRLVAKITQKSNDRRFVVVSAPGKRFAGDDKITDLLIQAHQGSARALEKVRARFLAIAEQLHMEEEIARELETIARRIFLSADYAASRGEYLSARILARLIDAPFVDAKDILCFDASGTLDFRRTYERTRAALKPLARAILPGFYGSLPDGSIRTFPRGGSDITGALVAGAMGAQCYENWTDVDGVFTADPRLVEGVRPIEQISYRQMRLLSSMGASVLHPDSIRPVFRAGIPIQLRNTFREDCPGTRIWADAHARLPLITGKPLESGMCVVAILHAEAPGLLENARASLDHAGIDCASHSVFADHLLFFLKAREFVRAVRALHEALVELPGDSRTCSSPSGTLSAENPDAH